MPWKCNSDLYDYSSSVCSRWNTKVEIICPVHGSFWQNASYHLKGRGCHQCARLGPKVSRVEFVKRSTEVHSGKYNYSLCKYVNAITKVEIICPLHGSFWQAPNKHYGKSGHGCFKCGSELRSANSTLDKAHFLKKAIRAHGDRYIYDRAVYLGALTKIEIVCREHGSFFQCPSDHYKGSGCRLCMLEKSFWRPSRWIESAERSKKFDGYKIYFVRLYNYCQPKCDLLSTIK